MTTCFFFLQKTVDHSPRRCQLAFSAKGEKWLSNFEWPSNREFRPFFSPAVIFRFYCFSPGWRWTSWVGSSYAIFNAFLGIFDWVWFWGIWVQESVIFELTPGGDFIDMNEIHWFSEN
jgi:hypothetical protein